MITVEAIAKELFDSSSDVAARAVTPLERMVRDPSHPDREWATRVLIAAHELIATWADEEVHVERQAAEPIQELIRVHAIVQTVREGGGAAGARRAQSRARQIEQALARAGSLLREDQATPLSERLTAILGYASLSAACVQRAQDEIRRLTAIHRAVRIRKPHPTQSALILRLAAIYSNYGGRPGDAGFIRGLEAMYRALRDGRAEGTIAKRVHRTLHPTESGHKPRKSKPVEPDFVPRRGLAE